MRHKVIGWTVTVASLLALGSGLGWALADDEDQPDSFWMQKKLEHTQDVLSALATEDFEAIGVNAEAMRRLSRLEGFVRRSNVEAYRTQLKVFEFANQELARHAREKNIDGAALAFTQLTLSCVNCHKEIRNLPVADN